MKQWIFVKKTLPKLLWTPSNLAVAPDWWFDAEAITGKSNNDQLDTWTNRGTKSSATRDPTHSVAGFPRYRTSQLNDLPGVEWNDRASGRGTRMRIGTAMAELTTTLRQSSLTVATVWKTSSVASGAAAIISASGYFANEVNRTAARANVSWWNNNFSDTVASSPTIGTTSGYLTVGVWDRTAATRTIFVNGTQEAQTTSLGSHTYTGGETIEIGNNGFAVPANGQMFSGTIHEIVMLTDNASTSDREKLEGYLAHKWGLAGDLPGGHPYKNAAPTF